MKKLLIYGCIAALALGLSSCADNIEHPSSEAAENPAQTVSVSLQKTEIIKEGKNADVSEMIKTFSSEYDVNDDGISDNISLYINAKKDENGILMMDDSQRWVLEVTDGISTYTLYDGLISNGAAYAQICEYYDGDDAYPVITLINSASAGLSITNYTYNKNAEGFSVEKVFSTDELSDSGINTIASSIPEPEAVN